MKKKNSIIISILQWITVLYLYFGQRITRPFSRDEEERIE